MRPLAILAALFLSAAADATRAGEQPVVVELYTSQGCSSCPPADRLAADLARRDDVLPLALHVDYWDYIGWPDDFADPRFTARQKAYAAHAADRMIYTPQMIVGGTDRLIGSRAAELAGALSRHMGMPQPVSVNATRDGTDRVAIEARLAPGAAGGPMHVHLVPFTPHERVEILGGENRGAVIDYVNVVRDWHVLADWNGDEPFRAEVEVDGPAAVLVQRAGPGAILGAARID